MKTMKDAMKAPSGLNTKDVLKGPKLGKVPKLASSPKMSAKLPTLKDLKIPPGGLMNKGLRQSYGKVPGLDT